MAEPYTNRYSLYPEYLMGDKYTKDPSGKDFFKMPTEFFDITDDLAYIGAEIEKQRSLGTPEGYKKAAELLRTYKNQLDGRYIDSDTINAFFEEIRNTQIATLQKKQFIYFRDDEPPAAKEYDVWICPNQILEDGEDWR